MTTAERLKIANNIYISYPRFKEIIGAIEYCHHFSSCKDEPECMFLSGSTGVGKTTIYRTYASRYPRQITLKGTMVPILAVTDTVDELNKRDIFAFSVREISPHLSQLIRS